MGLKTLSKSCSRRQAVYARIRSLHQVPKSIVPVTGRAVYHQSLEEDSGFFSDTMFRYVAVNNQGLNTIGFGVKL